MELKNYIYVEEDFPRKGISFKDVSPLLEDPEAFRQAIDQMKEIAEKWKPDLFVGPESRGFLFGTPLAIAMGKGFLMARKPGKLPRETAEQGYDLEYGTDVLQVHRDAFGPGDKVIIVDDLIATGGTMAAQVKLVEQLGAELVGVAVLTELEFFCPRETLAEVTDVPLHSLVKVQ